MNKPIDKPIIAITIGDVNGIGPEIALKAIAHPDVWKVCRPLLVGPYDAFAYYARKYSLRFSGIPVRENPTTWFKPVYPVLNLRAPESKYLRPGIVDAQAGLIAAHAIEAGVKLVESGQAHAIVTAPVSKKALHLAGRHFPGQTEMVQRLTGSKHVAMMLVSDTMRVGLATIHIPISKVAHTLTRPLLREKIQIVHAALRHDWKIPSPRVAVLGLNPHASEAGDIGREDLEIVARVIKNCRVKRMRIEGPFPADAFFGNYKTGKFDAVIAMYHDQGLIPLKMSSFGKGVNISVGLSIVRTSPDHGTAFDIAGKGIANPGSMIEAIRLAALVATNRGIVRRARRKKK